MISLAVLGFISLWGSFLWPLLAVQDERLMTLPLYLAQIKQQYRDVLDWPILMASATLAILPVLVFFVILQKPFFEQGSASEGIK
jgi:putative chitobiose transport system permease protein